VEPATCVFIFGRFAPLLVSAETLEFGGGGTVAVVVEGRESGEEGVDWGGGDFDAAEA